MTEPCQHLDYRREGDGREFAVARAYCTVADRFVRPVRADVCNRRYGLEPAEHCELYVEHRDGEDGDANGGVGGADDDGSAGTVDDAGDGATP